jgi:cysteine desulfurase
MTATLPSDGPSGCFYFDANATTPLCEAALAAMLPLLREHFGNPSSSHALGRVPAAAVARGREQVAALVGAHEASEVIFTGGGTESLNSVLHAAADRAPERTRILFSAGEHAAVLRPAEDLARRVGLELIAIPLNRQGQIDVDFALQALDGRTALLSLIHANNETGVLLPDAAIERLAERTRAVGAWFHLDAVASAGKVPLNAARWGLDLLSAAPHKFYGPKGIGILWVRRGTAFAPLLLGGSQEGGRRAGTVNPAGVAGAGAAAELAQRFAEDRPRVAAQAALRDRIEAALTQRFSQAYVVAAGAPRVFNTSGLVFPGLMGETIQALLSASGICVSAGSACGSSKRKGSHVLLAMGLPPEQATSAVRFSYLRDLTPAQAEQGLQLATAAIEQLYELAPA